MSEPPFAWLITAAHVVRVTDRYCDLVALLSSAQGKPVPVDFNALHKQTGLGWVIDKRSDLAVTLMPAPPEAKFTTLDLELTLPITSVTPSSTCYTLGCPYGMAGLQPGTAFPLVLGGIIAGVDRVNGKIFTTAPTFPGNSGGPLLVAASPFTITMGDSAHRHGGVRLAGIISGFAYIPHLPGVQDATTVPLHLGIAQGVEALHRLLQSRPARGLVDRAHVLSRGELDTPRPAR